MKLEATSIQNIRFENKDNRRITLYDYKLTSNNEYATLNISVPEGESREVVKATAKEVIESLIKTLKDSEITDLDIE